MKICSVSVAKEAFHHHCLSRRKHAVFMGLTTRKLAGEIAQGYAVANTLETVNLDAVAKYAAAVDDPEPRALESARSGIETGIERPFFISGENSRYHKSVKWLENTDALVDKHDLIVTSPAIQSGVSLDRPISKVFVLHENREVPADAVLQMVRRPRNPIDDTIVLGVRRWKKVQHRTDRPFLDSLLAKQSRTTIRAIVDSFPAFEVDHQAKVDFEFTWSWRITMRKLIRSYSNPIGALVESATRHGWEIDVDMENDGDGSEFNEITSTAKSVRTELNAESVANAEVIDLSEMAALEKAAKLMDGERQKLDRASIEAFYGLDITPELVVLDDSGRYRAKVKAYAHTVLIGESMSEVVAYLDHTRSKGKQPSQRTHDYARALLSFDLLSLLPGDSQFTRADIREPVMQWWKKNRQAAQTFFPRLCGPTKKYEARWLGDRLRALGAVVTTTGANSNRRTQIDFERVDLHAEAYTGRLLTAFEKVDEEIWMKEWKEMREG